LNKGILEGLDGLVGTQLYRNMGTVAEGTQLYRKRGTRPTRQCITLPPIEEKMFYFQDVLRLPHVILQDAYFSKRCILQDAVFVCHGLYYDWVGKRHSPGHSRGVNSDKMALATLSHSLLTYSPPPKPGWEEV